MKPTVDVEEGLTMGEVKAAQQMEDTLRTRRLHVGAVQDMIHNKEVHIPTSKVNKELYDKCVATFMDELPYNAFSIEGVLRTVSAHYNEDIMKLYEQAVYKFNTTKRNEQVKAIEDLLTWVQGADSVWVDNEGLVSIDINTAEEGMVIKTLKNTYVLQPDTFSGYNTGSIATISIVLVEEGNDSYTSISGFVNSNAIIKMRRSFLEKCASWEPLPIAGKTFVFVGFRSPDLDKYIQDNGGQVSVCITKNTDYLIATLGASTSGKVDKALKLGITIMSKCTLMKMCGLPDIEGIDG